MRDNGQGMFDMGLIQEVSKMSFTEGKELALSIISNSKANDKNRKKATEMIVKAKTLNAMLIAMSNFSLSHSGLKVI